MADEELITNDDPTPEPEPTPTPTYDPESILDSVKKHCGLPVDYTPFDDDIIDDINTELNTLNQAGIGVVGFQIEDRTSKWSDFLGEDDPKQALAKKFVRKRVRLSFDPPANSFVLEAKKAECDEMIWRANVQAEGSFED